MDLRVQGDRMADRRTEGRRKGREGIKKKNRNKESAQQERRAAGKVSEIKSGEEEAADCVITSETEKTEKRDN